MTIKINESLTKKTCLIGNFQFQDDLDPLLDRFTDFITELQNLMIRYKAENIDVWINFSELTNEKQLQMGSIIYNKN